MPQIKKSNLPEKTCVVCKRPYKWRKKWKLVWNEVKTMGDPRLIGIWPTEGYEYDASLGKYDEDHFLGLGLDEENQRDLHEERIVAWVRQIKSELKIS